MGKGRKRSRVTDVVALAIIPLLGAFLLVSGILGFIEGRYLGARTTARNTREAWRAFGEGAYSGESPVYLLLAAMGFSILIWFAALAHLKVRSGSKAPFWAIGLSSGVLFLASGTAWVMILVNWVSGVPFRNFQPMGADHLLYALWSVVPFIVAVASGYFGTRFAVSMIRGRKI